MGSYQVFSLRVKVDLGGIAMKGYSTFPKTPRLELYDQIVECHIQDIRSDERSYLSAQIQAVYSKNTAAWSVNTMFQHTTLTHFLAHKQGQVRGKNKFPIEETNY